MSQSSSPVPQRIGDVERDKAVEYLREHLAVGRIDQTEFDERLDQALTARYASDLDPLFVDLPAPKPNLPVAVTAAPAGPRPDQLAARPQPQSPDRNPAMVLGVLAAIAWPLAIIAMITFGSAGIGSHGWLLFFIPVLLSGAFGRYRGGRRR